MIRKQDGFTMTELLITMVIFVFAIMAMSNILVPLLTQFKQQSRIAETQIEGAVGLDVLRRDLEQAGFGLPWVVPPAITYQEGSSTTVGSIPLPNNTAYNDATANPPRGLATLNNVAALGGSDYLAIKATSVAVNSAAMKWTHVTGVAGGGNTVKVWSSAAEDLTANDRIIVLIPSRGAANQHILVNNGSAFSLQFSAASFPTAFAPSTPNDIYMIYGVDDATNLRMPFNRADYFIENVTGTTIPARCAPGTGVLMKYLISQANGNRTGGMPLLDCVADMQVIFILDRNNDGTIDAVTDVLNDTSGAALTAQELREQLREVRVYILAHEGQRDPNFTYPNSTITIPTYCSAPNPDPGCGAGRTFNFTTSGITGWQNYRWKVYTIVVQPNNMRT